MQNFRTLGLIIKKVRNLFNLSDKYGKIIRCVLKYYYLKRDTSKAQSYNVLRNFFKYADLLEFEFQQIPEKNIKKEVFIESVTR